MKASEFRDFLPGPGDLEGPELSQTTYHFLLTVGCLTFHLLLARLRKTCFEIGWPFRSRFELSNARTNSCLCDQIYENLLEFMITRRQDTAGKQELIIILAISCAFPF
jgi:hypothetical protein